MNNSTKPEQRQDPGVRNGPVASAILARKGSGCPTLDTLCASSIGLDRDEGARVFSPCFNSLPSASSSRVQLSTHQSIFSMVVMISPKTASTPISQPLVSHMQGGLTSLSSIPTCYSADCIHVPQHPSPQTAQNEFPLSECSLLPTRLCRMSSFDLFLYLRSGE